MTTLVIHGPFRPRAPGMSRPASSKRSEEHTSELQSLRHLVCRLLLRRRLIFTLFPYTTLFRSNVDVPPLSDDLWATLDSLRAAKNSIFFSHLTERAVDLFQ